MEGLRTVHADLTEQLNLVNQATEANSAAVFARAAEVSAASAKSVDAYTAQLKSVAQ
jgi:hypothetical protein